MFSGVGGFIVKNRSRQWLNKRQQSYEEPEEEKSKYTYLIILTFVSQFEAVKCSAFISSLNVNIYAALHFTELSFMLILFLY